MRILSIGFLSAVCSCRGKTMVATYDLAMESFFICRALEMSVM